MTALFYDLSPEKVVTIPGHPERRERDLQELVRKAKKPVVLFVDDAHDLHGNTLKALKRLIELVQDGGGQLSVVLIGHPRLKNDLRRPKMEEIGDRATVLEFGGLRDRQRAYLDWALTAAPRTASTARRSSPKMRWCFSPPSSRHLCRSVAILSAPSKRASRPA